MPAGGVEMSWVAQHMASGDFGVVCKYLGSYDEPVSEQIW